MSEQDICANRHRGNEQSKEAFEKVESGLPNQRAHILLMVQKAGFKGLTVHEAAELLNTTPNAVRVRVHRVTIGLICLRNFTSNGYSEASYIQDQGLRPGQLRALRAGVLE